MNIVLTALCASYSHTPLALYALKASAGIYAEPITLLPFTINQADDLIRREIFAQSPDILGFSCYIWNIEKTVRLASALRLVLPEAIFILGGPEMAAEYETYLLNNIADIIVPGEGERPFFEIIKLYAEQGRAAFRTQRHWLAHIPGIAYCPPDSPAIRNDDTAASNNKALGHCFVLSNAILNNDIISRNPPGEPLNMAQLPFPYPPGLNGLDNKALYYESSRGCPFACGYCLSSVSEKLRFKPLDLVKNDLLIFLNAKVRRVKFTDRTFNAAGKHAIAIWEFLMENDNGVTNFHFEIAADLLSEDALTLLRAARPGLFQFEVGVQSTHIKSLAAVNRVTHLPRLFENVKRLASFRNIHLHLDLIAGLPEEDMTAFIRSFNTVYDLRPQQLQLGFLKLLKGTDLRRQARALGLTYAVYPPYEILSTPTLSFRELLELKDVEDAVETFHNSGLFTQTLAYLIRHSPSAYGLFEKIARYLRGTDFYQAPHGKLRLYDALYNFSTAFRPPEEEPAIQDLLRYDLYQYENERGLPACLNENTPDTIRQRAYMKGRDARAQRAVFFRTDVLALIGGGPPIPMEHFLLFDYSGKETKVIYTKPNYFREGNHA